MQQLVVLRDLLLLRASSIDEHEVSLNALNDKWTPFFENLPELTPEQVETGKKMIEFEEKRRRKAMQRYLENKNAI